MKISIKATNMDLTEALRNYINEKIGAGLDKFIDHKEESIMADVEIGLLNQHHQKGEIYRAEVNINVAGTLLRAESNSEDQYAAIDILKDEAIRVITSHRSKKETLIRKGARKFKSLIRWDRK